MTCPTCTPRRDAPPHYHLIAFIAIVMSDLCLPRYLTLLLMLVMMVPSAYAQRYQFTPSDRVDSLIAEMTLEEKVGQMTQVTLTAIAADGPRESGRVNLDPVKLSVAILTYHVCSLFTLSDDKTSPACTSNHI